MTNKGTVCTVYTRKADPAGSPTSPAQKADPKMNEDVFPVFELTCEASATDIGKGVTRVELELPSLMGAERSAVHDLLIRALMDALGGCGLLTSPNAYGTATSPDRRIQKIFFDFSAPVALPTGGPLEYPPLFVNRAISWAQYGEILLAMRNLGMVSPEFYASCDQQRRASLVST